MRERKRKKLSILQIVLNNQGSIDKLLKLTKKQVDDWRIAKVLAKFKREFSQEFKDYTDMLNEINAEFRAKISDNIDKKKEKENGSEFNWVALLPEAEAKKYNNEINDILENWEFEIDIPVFKESDFYKKLYDKSLISADELAVYGMLGMIEYKVEE